MPSPGAIIFFDWEHDEMCDHVRIVERCDGTIVYTVEGNSWDAVREKLCDPFRFHYGIWNGRV
ncbi:CHAP domain-containing protein [Dorea longicatena]|uniref:CHAP domain-containing protein n=1 Tax=Dorea longicatena TaxID=88431 RepID=UPI002ED26693